MSTLTTSHISFSNVTFLHTTADTIAAAREWILECEWMNESVEDLEDEVASSSDSDIVRAIHRHYAGGWNGFVAAR